MIANINENSYVKNINYPYINKNQINTVSFGKSETGDSFEKEYDNNPQNTGLFSKTVQKIKNFILFNVSKILGKLDRYCDSQDTTNLNSEEIAFKETPEGIRRGKMSDKEIEHNAQIVFDKAFDELNVPKENRPKLKMKYDNNNTGGSYEPNKHEIYINQKPYIYGKLELEQAIMHEATHCKQSLQIASIPQNRINEIMKDCMNTCILTDAPFDISVKNGGKIIRKPVMTQKMKNDFIKFAEENLYKKSLYLEQLKHTNDFSSDKNMGNPIFTGIEL